MSFMSISSADSLACPDYGECSYELDKDTCLFMSKKPQYLFSNEICAELPNGKLYAFMIPADSPYYFYPHTFFYPYPNRCSYFTWAPYGVTLRFRNAWLIVGVQTVKKTSIEEIIRLDLQHATTKKTTEIRYRKTATTFKPIGKYTVIGNYTVMKEVYARNPSKDNPLAILVYYWGDLRPQHEWQHVRTFKELLEVDKSEGSHWPYRNRATCVFPSLRKLCASFSEDTGECVCPSGMSGRFCEKDINECEQSPCTHGTCINTRGSYDCACEDGWAEKHCDKDINECEYQYLCGTRGTCENTNGSFRCYCPPGMTGRYCDTDIEECSEQPNLCKPKGKCIETFGSYKCHCLPGWTGELCNSDIDECASEGDTCFNKGTCVNTNGSYVCHCDQYWTGPRCQEEVDLCDQLDCVNGLCVTKEHAVREVECKCFEGWTGQSCTIDIDECGNDRNLCLNEGTCLSTGNYSCTCVAGYTGKNCEKDINECASAACLNGYCIDLLNGFICNCYDGWAGVKCDNNLQLCSYAKYDCGKGSCVAEEGVPRCKCPSGYTGEHCETRVSSCESYPCLSGVCFDGERIGEFNCICEDGFSGLDCSISDNPCVPSPCINGGTCTVNRSVAYGYLCTCKKGFGGGMCEMASAGSSPIAPSVIQLAVAGLFFWNFATARYLQGLGALPNGL